MTFVAYEFFFFQEEDGIGDGQVTGVQACAFPFFFFFFFFFSLPNVAVAVDVRCSVVGCSEK